MRTDVHLAPVLAVLLLGSCVTSGKPAAKKDVGPWLEPSATLADQIDDKVQRLPWTNGMERVELIHWFAAVGEPAYPTMLELCLDSRADVAGAALAALGATGDSRLVEHIRGLDWPKESPEEVRLERARTLLRLGDWSEVPSLIDGLESESLYVRAVCAKALYESTRESFGFDPRDSEPARETSVALWRAWWTAKERDPFQADSSDA